MKNKTCEDAADAVIAAGGGKSLIIKALHSVFGQGYNRGYRTKTTDVVKAGEAKKKAIDSSFKKELDKIEDVRTAKWE